MIFTETWLNSDIIDVNIPGYTIECRKDRQDTTGGKGGGIIVYVKSGLKVLVEDIDNNFNQFCSFCIKSTDQSANFLCFYRSPNSTRDNDELLCKLVSECKKKCYIIGDLNYPKIDWENGLSDTKSSAFLETVQEKFLTQCIDFPTHTKGNILDVLITDVPDTVLSVEDIGIVGKSDHVLILCEIAMSLNKSCTSQTVPDWNKGDIDGAKQNLNLYNWEEVMANMTTNEAWDCFLNKASDIHSKFIPNKNRRNPNKPPWLNRELVRLQRKKGRLWRKYKKTQSETDFEQYKECRKSLQRRLRSARRNFEKKLASEDRNPRAFNSYIKSKNSNKVSVGPLKNIQGEALTDNVAMATEMNNFFSSVFTSENTLNVPPVTALTEKQILSVKVTPAKVKEKIKKLKPGSAPGPDGITVRYLQTFSEELSLPLSTIYNKSLTEGVVPDDWRKANVTPIFKKGSKSQACNYRPVSLTSIPCKILESIIKDVLVKHLDTLIKPSQHGFMRNKSVTTNLLEFMEVITSAVDDGDTVDVVYLDFAKAFDKVPKERLLHQLESHGVKRWLLDWIRAWLSDRQQRVVLNGEFSSWSEVLSGVPQGSILGPVCFIIYINNLENGTDQKLTMLSKFADDTKAGKIIRSEADRKEFQQSLDSFCRWADTWQMEFNVKKCKIMHFGKQNPGYEYTMNNVKLDSTKEERDIGVLICDNLKQSTQCASAAKRANAVLGQISRAFHFRDKNVFIKLYKQYVRCHLEFATSAWNPWTVTDTNLLESVQIRAVKMVTGLSGQTYEEKLKEIGLPSLAARRIRADMLQVFKIVNGFDKVDSNNWFTFVDQRERNTRSTADSLNLIQPGAKTEVRKQFFSCRVVKQWNSIPYDIKRARNPDQFKLLYDKWMDQQ